jgi:hypothetical protein
LTLAAFRTGGYGEEGKTQQLNMISDRRRAEYILMPVYNKVV